MSLHTLAASPSLWPANATVMNDPVLWLKVQAAACRTFLDCFFFHFITKNVKKRHIWGDRGLMKGDTHWKRRWPGWWWLLWTPRKPTELSCGNSAPRGASDAYCSPKDLRTTTDGTLPWEHSFGFYLRTLWTYCEGRVRLLRRTAPDGTGCDRCWSDLHFLCCESIITPS